MEVFVNILHSCLCIWVFIRNTFEVSFCKVVSSNVQKYLALAIFLPLAYSSHPSHNNLNNHHHHHTTNTSTTTIIIIVVIVITCSTIDWGT